MRGISYSHNTSPPRFYGRIDRSPSPRVRYGRPGRDLSTSLLVRNLRHDCRPEDLRRPFGRFGPIKDIYLPRNYYTGEPRGFGFVQFVESSDAAEAKYEMNGQILLGRELTVVFAEENRKKPADMRARERVSVRSRSYDRQTSRASGSPRYHRPRSPWYERSSHYRRSRSRSRSYSYSPPPRNYSRSVSPADRRYDRERSPPYQSRSRSPGYPRKRGHTERSASFSE